MAARRQVNIHGLGRDIPLPIKRVVRRECMFGCVLCGSFPFQYDHFDPEWPHCKKHRSAGIALLCGSCHGDKTAGRVSVQTVAEARAEPYNVRNEPVWKLRPGRKALSLEFGGFGMEPCHITGDRVVGVTSLSGGDVLVVRNGTDDVPVISATFLDGKGRVLLSIVENELTVNRESWDIDFVGTRLTIRSGLRRIALEICFFAEASTFRVSRIHMRTARGVLLTTDVPLRLSGGRPCVFGIIGGPTMLFAPGSGINSDGLERPTIAIL